MIPSKIEAKAQEMLIAYNNGTIRPRKTYGKKYPVMELPSGYRMVLIAGKWNIFTHNEYIRKLDRKR